MVKQCGMSPVMALIAAYKNKNDIKERVKAMVSTYRPAAEKAEEEVTAPDGKKEGAAL